MGQTHIEKATLAKTLAETDAATNLARRISLEADDIQHERDIRAASEWENRIFVFDQTVNAASVQECMRILGLWVRRSSEPIEISFNSPGGSVFDGLALYDFIQQIRARGVRVDTAALGMAASMGGVLLQAGEKRTMSRNSYLLIHEVSSGAEGKMEEIEDRIKFTRRLQERLVAILAERSSMTEEEIRERWARKDWWLDADEALELGFCDEVI